MIDNQSSTRAWLVIGTIWEHVEMKLRRLVELGVLKTLMHSFLAAPVVVVPKDISARICGDHKMTVY